MKLPALGGVMTLEVGAGHFFIPWAGGELFATGGGFDDVVEVIGVVGFHA